VGVLVKFAAVTGIHVQLGRKSLPTTINKIRLSAGRSEVDVPVLGRNIGLAARSMWGQRRLEIVT
jgi:hypothetical protein